MSKELEYIRDISCLISENYSDKEPLTEEQKLSKNCFLDYCKYIEKELKRLESIDSAKPSEALEYLENLGTHRIEYKESFKLNSTKTMPLKSTINYTIIHQALIKAQEQEKELDDKLIFKNGHIMSGFDYKGKSIVAMPSDEYSKLMEQKEVLKIIMKKDVNFEVFDTFETYNDYEIYYNNKFHLIENKLTEEEFDLVKRYFENE